MGLSLLRPLVATDSDPHGLSSIPWWMKNRGEVENCVRGGLARFNARKLGAKDHNAELRFQKGGKKGELLNKK